MFVLSFGPEIALGRKLPSVACISRAARRGVGNSRQRDMLTRSSALEAMSTERPVLRGTVRISEQAATWPGPPPQRVPEISYDRAAFSSTKIRPGIGIGSLRTIMSCA